MGSEARATKRFGEKRDAIVHAASVLINDTGVQATTLAKVARAIGLNATSVTYYFPRKDQLVIATYEETIALLKAMAEEASAEPTVRARIAKFIGLHVALRERIRRGENGLITALSEVRSLERDQQEALGVQYRRFYNIMRGFFGTPADDLERARNTARAHVLIEAMMWWPVWSRRYSRLDFPRVERRLVDMLCRGLPAIRGTWNPVSLEGATWRTDLGDPQSQNDAFMRAATGMINERGYRGASVNRIAESLNVTKGSFYHHHDAKDDLVMDCFQFSYDRMSRVQMAALNVEGDYWTRLSTALSALLEVQFFDPMPFLRTTALQALDANQKSDVVTRSNRLARRFAGFLIDGIADGSVHPIDPLVASQVIMSTLDAAYEARRWAARFEDREVAKSVYLSVLYDGLVPEGE